MGSPALFIGGYFEEHGRRFGPAPIAIVPEPMKPSKATDDGPIIGMAIALPLALDAVFSPSPPDYGTGAGLDSTGAPIDSGGGL
jgi:hypothetical protein